MGLKLSSKDLLKEDNSSGSGNPQKTGWYEVCTHGARELGEASKGAAGVCTACTRGSTAGDPSEGRFFKGSAKVPWEENPQCWHLPSQDSHISWQWAPLLLGSSMPSYLSPPCSILEEQGPEGEGTEGNQEYEETSQAFSSLLQCSEARPGPGCGRKGALNWMRD